MDAKCDKYNLDGLSKYTPHVSKSERGKIEQLLKRYETLFDGSIETWNMDCYKVQLKDDIKPYHGIAYQFLKAHEYALKNAIDRLVKIVILKSSTISMGGQLVCHTKKRMEQAESFLTLKI